LVFAMTSKVYSGIHHFATTDSFLGPIVSEVLGISSSRRKGTR